MAAVFAAGVAGVAAAVAVASVNGGKSSVAPSPAAANLRLITTVVRRDVPVDGGVGQISCPTKTLRGGPSWVAVGGGVEGKSAYAVGRSYPSFADAKGRRGWTAYLTPMPSLLPLGGRPEQTVLTDLANYPGPFAHRHHIVLPSSLLVNGRFPKQYTSLRMYVVCASLAPAAGGPFRLVTSVARSEVGVDDYGVARIGCLGAVAGGVVGGTGWAVAGSYPALNSQGQARGWSGTLAGLPRFTFMAATRFQPVLTDVGNRATFWSHRHHATLPSDLLLGAPRAVYSSVRMSVICASIRPATGLYRLNTTVVSREVPSSGVAKIFCPTGSSALGGGVVGNTAYAVGGSYPVADAHGQATGWAGTLTELPRTSPLGNGGTAAQTILTDVGNFATVWHHRHHILLPAALLQGRTLKGYSKVRMYVVCATLGGGQGPIPVGVPKTPRVPVTTKSPAPPPPPTTTTAPTTTAPKPTTTTTATTTQQQLPDLVVRKLFLDGSTLVWNIEIRNRGDGDAPASKTGLTQPPGSDEQRIDTPPIKAGDSVTVTAQCPYGSIGDATARSDAGNDVAESDEGNNNFGPVKGGLAGGDGNWRCRYP